MKKLLLGVLLISSHLMFGAVKPTDTKGPKDKVLRISRTTKIVYKEVQKESDKARSALMSGEKDYSYIIFCLSEAMK